MNTATFERLGRTWVRHDPCTHDAGCRCGGASLFAAGPDDRSPYHFITGGYDPACGRCWLNSGHTEAEHLRNLNR
jgi:hypothetical protein